MHLRAVSRLKWKSYEDHQLGKSLSSQDHRFSAVTVCVTLLPLLMPFGAPLDDALSILKERKVARGRTKAGRCLAALASMNKRVRARRRGYK